MAKASKVRLCGALTAVACGSPAPSTSSATEGGADHGEVGTGEASDGEEDTLGEDLPEPVCSIRSQAEDWLAERGISEPFSCGELDFGDEDRVWIAAVECAQQRYDDGLPFVLFYEKQAVGLRAGVWVWGGEGEGVWFAATIGDDTAYPWFDEQGLELEWVQFSSLGFLMGVSKCIPKAGASLCMGHMGGRGGEGCL